MKNINALIKIFLTIFVFVNVTFVNAYAFATKRPEFPVKKVDYRSTNDVWYEDFTTYQEGKKPKKLIITERAGVTMNIIATDTPDYKEKNVFRLTDTDGPRTGRFVIPVPEVQQSFTFVTRFRYNTLEAGQVPQFIFYAGTPDKNAFFLWYLSGGFHLASDIPDRTLNTFMKNANLESGVWYTLKIRVDMETRTTSVYLQGDTIKKEGVNFIETMRVNKNSGEFVIEGIPWSTTYTDNSINELTFNTYTASIGEIDFDYMKIEADSEPLTVRKKVYPKIPYTTISVPVVRPLMGTVNLTLNGEYFNFVNRPYIIDDLIMIKARDFAKLNGLIYILAAGEIVLKDESNEIRMKIGTSEATVNGNKVALPVNIEEDTFIPLNEFGKLMNMTVNYNEAANTVEIIK